MPDAMPLQMVLASALFVGFLNTHQRHAFRFQGTSRSYLVTLYVSEVLGTLIGLGLLIYYFMQVGFFWTAVLFAVSSLIAGFVFALLDSLAGQLVLSLTSYVGWPLTAVWLYSIVRNLNS